MAEHTPTPWRVEYDGPSRPIIFTSDPATLLTLGRLEGGQGVWYRNEDTDALFIVRSVNLHDELVAAAEVAYEAFDNHYDGDATDSRSQWMVEPMQRLAAVLRKAGKEVTA